MSANLWPRLRILPTALAVTLTSLVGSFNAALAQERIPTCEPPNAGEFLLLVISPTIDNQNQLRQSLPGQLKTNVCRYLNETVTRVGGFNKIDDANRWARYINNVAGLSAIITTRPGSTSTAQKPQAEPANFKPQSLGNGYAVLVEYYNRPELASQVQKVIGGDVGFVTYGQRPYLLALYTTDQKEAYETLQQLNERGFYAVLVNSSRVVLLRRSVVQR